MSTARYRVTVVDCAAGEHSRSRLATRSRAPAHEQRGPVHGRARDRDVRGRSCGGRSTSPSGSGTPSCASSGSASPSRTPRCSTSSDGVPFAQWFTGGRTNLAISCVDRWADDPATRRPSPPWSGKARRATVRTLTFVELRTLTDRIASGLAARGVSAGDAVGLFVPMVPETVAALFAIAKLGALFLPIFSGYGADAVAIRLEDAGAVAFDHRRRLHASRPRRADEGDGGRRRRAGPVGAHRRRRAAPRSHRRADAGRARPHARPNWRRLGADRFDALDVDSEHPLFVAYTSGTTGRPKGAVHVHGGFLVKIAEEVAFQMDLRPRRAAVLADRHRLDHGAVGDRRHARQRRDARALRRRARLIPGPTASGRSSSGIGSAILGVSPTLVRALMAHGDEPVRAHDLSSLRVLALDR